MEKQWEKSLGKKREGTGKPVVETIFMLGTGDHRSWA